MSRVYLDTNVFVYAVGADSRFRDPCREILRAVAERRLVAETSVHTLQELVHQRQRRGDRDAATRGREAASMCSALHPLDRAVGAAALDAVDRYPGLGIADAVHAATALAHGISTLVSADSDFDRVAAIERVDPLDAGRLAALASG